MTSGISVLPVPGGTIGDVLETPLAWYSRLPGMNPDRLPGDTLPVNRLIAFMCAQRVYGGADATQAKSGNPKIQALAAKMFEWLDEAGNDVVDGYERRLLLTEACQQIVRVPDYFYLSYAQWAYKVMHGLPLPERYKEDRRRPAA